jgi:hypothetical protein
VHNFNDRFNCNAISAALLDSKGGAESRRSRRISEIWEITGATGAVGDTVAITTRHIKKPKAVVSGAFSYTISGQVITLTAKAQIDNAVVAVEIIGEN